MERMLRSNQASTMGYGQGNAGGRYRNGSTPPHRAERGGRDCLSCHGRENTSRNDLLTELRQIDFALYDTILYLDAYPDCAEALAHYHALCDKRRALMTEYEAKVGPITAFGNASRGSWNWTETPWPWHNA